MIKRRAIAGILAITFSTSSVASVQSQMQEWFNEMGAYGNVTGAQIVTGQTGTSYMGGSVYMRTPVRNYQIASFSPPSVRAGCGGIDAFAGSFSFINSENFTALLRNVANNAVGYAFQIAIESVSPEMAGVLKYLQDQAAKINSMTQNSCQLAQGIVNDVGFPDMLNQKEYANRVSNGASFLNMFSDAFESKAKTDNDPNAASSVTAQTKTNDPALGEVIDPGNIVWNALNKTNIPDDELKRMMMSFIGTYILLASSSTDNKVPRTGIQPGILSFIDLIGSPNQEFIPDKRIYSCTSDTPHPCATMDETTTQIPSLAYKVKKSIEKGQTAIWNRTNVLSGLSTTDASIYQNTAVPVWRLTSASAITNGVPDLLIDEYSRVIAAELAYKWYSDVLKVLSRSLAKAQEKGAPAIAKAISELNGYVNTSRSQAAAEMQKIHTTSMNIAQMQRQIQWMHQSAMSQLSSDVKKSLSVFNSN